VKKATVAMADFAAVSIIVFGRSASADRLGTSTHNRWNRRDRLVILGATFVRAIATAMTGVLLGVYLQRLHFSAFAIGAVIAAGLAGGALAALLATVAADRIGRRRFLFAIALLGAVGGGVVAFASAQAAIFAAAFLGMINGMGRDRGAALVVEQAILPATVPDRERTGTFARYNVVQAAGAALGALAAGAPALIQRRLEISHLAAMRAGMGLYAALMLAVALLYLFLTGAVEIDSPPAEAKISSHSRRLIARLSALFLLDSLGGGFMTQAMISYFFVERFGASVTQIGALFFGAAIANALSQFAAAWLARRIGLVNTMVFTHMPGSLLITAVAFAPNLTVASILFLARESLVQMDVPTRQSYVMAVVRPAERTFASGVTGLVRMGGWAIAPALAGLMMQGVSLATPFIIGPGLKVAYDLLLYRAFSHHRPPEEREC
jgi:MFS family permease